MKIYLVGGVLRDAFLGLPIREKDFMVTGATPEEMTALGFIPVGRDFPVFLHPKTHEEYALARTERKTGKGHQGFQFYTAPNVSLADDLKRRDFTINAMAKDLESGEIIDPYRGKYDLESRVIRHVSEAFSEDPLRILRAARLQAYLGAFSFVIAPETLAFMQAMVANQVLTELSGERIWNEIARALASDFPEYFLDTLAEINAMGYFFKNYSDQARKALINAKQLSNSPLIRFAAFAHEVDYTLKLPNDFDALATMVKKYSDAALAFENLTAQAKVNLLKKLDYLRRPERFHDWQLASLAIHPAFPVNALNKAAETLRVLDRASIGKDIHSPQNIAEAIFKAECQALEDAGEFLS